jgi:transposase
MRPKGSAAELERRRRLAVARLEQGEAPAEVAQSLGVTATSLLRWQARAALPQGLAARPHQGPRRRLSAGHLAELKALLPAAGPHGWPGPAWTVRRVAGLIFRRFGIAYHPEHVRKLLREWLGWTGARPCADGMLRVG